MRTKNPTDKNKSFQPQFRSHFVFLLALLAFLPRLFAVGNDNDPGAKISARVVIGHVTFQLTNQEIRITGSNLSVTLECPLPFIQDYVCAVRNPFARPKLFDGFVQSDANYRVLKDDGDFKASAFPRFAFFTKRRTTIGLLTGHAAANGGSVQQLFLVDVATSAHVLIPLEEGEMPQWLERTNYPPAFVTHRQMGYKGWHRSCLGQAYRFKAGGYQRDMVTEQRLLSAVFVKLALTEAQRKELREADDGILDDWMSPTGASQALGDFVYYGTLTGNGKIVDDLVDTLQPALRVRLRQLRQTIDHDSRTNIVTGTVAPAPDPLPKQPNWTGSARAEVSHHSETGVKTNPLKAQL